jgi:hypothetical protein
VGRVLRLPAGVDGDCLEEFLKLFGKAYADNHFLIVFDSAPSHRSN